MKVGKLSNMKLSTLLLDYVAAAGGSLSDADRLALIDIANSADANDDPVRTDVVNKLLAVNPTLGITTASEWTAVRAAIATMLNRGSPTITPSTTDQTLQPGYYGGGTVSGDADLVSANVKAGTNIFGVAGKTEVVDTTTAAGATAAQILAGREGFANGAKVVGTMPEIAGDVAATNIDGSSTLNRLRLRPPKGYYDGAAPRVYADSPDFIAANILSGKNIFGLAGAAVSGSVKATGSTTSVISVSTDQYEKISVRGLAFKPIAVSTPDKDSVIVALGAGYKHIYPIEGTTNGLTSTTSMGTGVTQFNIYADGFDMIIRRWTGGGGLSGASRPWEAYG